MKNKDAIEKAENISLIEQHFSVGSFDGDCANVPISEIADLLRQTQENHIVQAHEKVNEAYTQRMMVVRMLALKSGCKFGLGKDDNEDWDDEWRNVVYIDLPEGQVSYHIAPHDMHLFNDFPVYEGKWDGKFSGGCVEFIKSIQAQEKPCVDVERLKKEVHIAHLKQAYGNHPDNAEDIEVGIIREEYAYHYGGEDASDFAVDYLAKQGHLTLSEKPTSSIPEKNNQSAPNIYTHTVHGKDYCAGYAVNALTDTNVGQIPEGYAKKLAEISHECVGAMQCLSVHNQWRRGKRDDQDDPKAVGESIDIAVRAMDFLIGLHVKQAMIKAGK